VAAVVLPVTGGDENAPAVSRPPPGGGATPGCSCSPVAPVRLPPSPFFSLLELGEWRWWWRSEAGPLLMAMGAATWFRIQRVAPLPTLAGDDVLSVAWNAPVQSRLSRIRRKLKMWPRPGSELFSPRCGERPPGPPDDAPAPILSNSNYCRHRMRRRGMMTACAN